MDFHKMYSILQKAQDTYGYSNQMSVVAEECCELAKECNKYVRYPDHTTASDKLRAKILEETADMVICLNHLYMMFGITPLEQEAVIWAKLERLERWINTTPSFYNTTIDREVKKIEPEKI